MDGTSSRLKRTTHTRFVLLWITERKHDYFGTRKEEEEEEERNVNEMKVKNGKSNNKNNKKNEVK